MKCANYLIKRINWILRQWFWRSTPMIAHLWMFNINIGPAFYSMIEESKIGIFRAILFVWYRFCINSIFRKMRSDYEVYFDSVVVLNFLIILVVVVVFDFIYDWIVVVLTCSIFAHITMFRWNSNHSLSWYWWKTEKLRLSHVVFTILSYVWYVWHGKPTPIFIIISLMLLSVNLVDVTKPLSDQ